jgi:hypothetical protein
LPSPSSLPRASWEHVPVPLELIAQHADRLGQYDVRNVDADVSGPRVADDYGRLATEMQRPDIDAGIEVALITVRLSSVAALLSSGFGYKPVYVGLFDPERLRPLRAVVQ